MTDIITDQHGFSYQPITAGDIEEHDPRDWILYGVDSPLMKEIKKLPKAPSPVKVLNQKSDKKHYTSCTKFAAMNGISLDTGMLMTLDEVNEVEEESKKRGRAGTGSGRYRAGGVNTVRDLKNKKNPDSVASFLMELFSPEFWEYLATGRTIICSINVNTQFWLDVMYDKRLDGMNFKKGVGHATCFRKNLKTDLIEFYDSAGPIRGGLYDGIVYTMTMEQLREKADKLKTLRYDCHIFIPKKIVPMIAKDVPAGQRYSTAVAEVIEDEIMSVNKDGNFNPNEPVTRAMFAQVIKNLKDKGFIVKQP